MFNIKKLEPKCVYCAVGTPSPDGGSVVCVRYGIMLPDSSCHAFEYDALKRTPPKKARLPEFSESDFTLDLDKVE